MRNWKLKLKMLYCLQYYLKYEIFSDKYVKLCTKPIHCKLANTISKKLKNLKKWREMLY